MSRRELSVRLGDLGRSVPVRLPRQVSQLGVFVALGALVALSLLGWQLWRAARIYPDLLLQIRRNSVLHHQLEELAARKEVVAVQVAETDRVAGMLLARFGLREAPRKRDAFPEGGRLLEILFPETSQEGRLAAESWQLGEQVERRAVEMRAAAKIGTDRIRQWENTPSVTPAWGDFSSGFGWRFHPVLGKYAMHEGQDIANRIGTPVAATAAGRVEVAEFNGSFGNHVVINHGRGLRTLYAHFSALRCKVGDQVRRGQVIGLLGNTGRSTGPHVHYEVHKGETPVNPMNWILPVTLVP